MAHKRKDTSVIAKSWNVHLRPEGKRAYHKAERRNAAQLVEEVEVPPAFAKRQKPGRKRFGLRRNYGQSFTEMWPGWSGYTSWYATEKARDDAYNAAVRINSNPSTPAWRTGYTYVKVER